MKLRCSLYARPVIVRGQHCAEAWLSRRSDRAATRQGSRQSRAGRWPHRRAVMVAKRRSAVHRNTVGWPSARPLDVVAQEVRTPAVPSSACPHPRPAAGVQCPVRTSSLRACLSTRPVSRGRCRRLSFRVSGLRCPLCPTGVRSWRAAVGCWRGEASAWTWPSSWEVVGRWLGRPRGRPGEAGCARIARW